MPTLKERLYDRLESEVGYTQEELIALSKATLADNLDPFLYTDADLFVEEFHKLVLDDSEGLIIIDTDFDADGINSANVLAAAFDLFGLPFAVYIPSMEDGYGLSPKAVDDMEKQFGKIKAIVTADNGTFASGVAYARKKGIKVLVTDHHTGKKENQVTAEAVINPNREGDTYPFKGNAGAHVALKMMQAYAMRYAKDKLPLLDRLHVFAGIADVSDVMPIRDENHTTVKYAIEELNRLKKGCYVNTPYPIYNRVFQGLHLLLVALQQDLDRKNRAKKKRPEPLPSDEKLISFHISPALNAPRRIHDSPYEAFVLFLADDEKMRQEACQKIIAMNTLKSQWRDTVLDDIDNMTNNVILINAKHGVAGLVAPRLLDYSEEPSVVFTTQDSSKPIGLYKDGLPDDERISASARSRTMGLDKMIEYIQTHYPTYGLEGGGHTGAAGFSIKTEHFPWFIEAWNKSYHELLKDYPLAQKDKGFHIILEKGNQDNYYLWEKLTQKTYDDILSFLSEIETFKPFGKDFNPVLKASILIQPSDERLSFWKTVKIKKGPLTAITFNEDLATTIRQAKEPLLVTGDLVLNRWQGNTSLQLQMTHLETPKL